MRLCIVQPTLDALSETFLRAHAERLPAETTVVHRESVPYIGGRPVLSQSLPARATRRIARMMRRQQWSWELTEGYLAAFRRTGAQAVLAEYGPTGVSVIEACSLAGVPLIVHFHGYDASCHALLKERQADYGRLFEAAAAIVSVSRAMERRLLSIGAQSAKLVRNPYGVDVKKFFGADPGRSEPTFVAVGRFVEKKAPHLTLLAFAEVARRYPGAKLIMIGGGHLLGPCRDMAVALGVGDAVEFLGPQPHDIVRRKMQQARAFVQHSIEASNGDCEGTPVAVIEAGAMGLPVVATRHAGIPDVVVHGDTGLLVAERDVQRMADHMLELATSPALAAKMGAAARRRVEQHFTMDQSIERLWSVIKACIDRVPLPVENASLDSADAESAGIGAELPIEAGELTATSAGL